MSQSNELDAGGGGGTESGASRTRFDLGDGSEWVDGRFVDWRALVSYLFTISALIFSETLGRLVSGLFALPQRGIDTAGSMYAALASEVVGFWPEIFSSSFDTAALSIAELGVVSFAAAVAFVIVWFVVINELVEVL